MIDRMIKTQVQKSTTSVPKVISNYVLPNKNKRPVAMNIMLSALEKEFGILRNMSGTVADMREAILRQPMNLANEDVLNGNTKMGLLPGWYSNPNNLSESVSNAWMTIADLRKAVVDIQKNFLGNTTCQDIIYDVSGSVSVTEMGVVHGILLDFSGTKVNSPFADCGGQSKITVEDTDFNSITKYINVVTQSKAIGGTLVNFQNSNINRASNYKVTVDMCFTDGDSQCAKSIQFNLENNNSCPTITFPSVTGDTINFKLEGVNGDSYDLTVVIEGQGGGEYGRRVFSGSKQAMLNGSFSGLPAGKTFNVYVELRSKGSGVVTKCPTVSAATSTPACTTSSILSSDFKSNSSHLMGNSLQIACYNDTVSTYNTKAGFDASGNFAVIKTTDDVNTSCTAGTSINSNGNFISDTSGTPLIINSIVYASTVGAGKIDSGWKFIGTLVNPYNSTIHVYALINKDTNSVDRVIGSCDCALNFINNKPMNYCTDSGSVICKVNVIGSNIASSDNEVSITSQPYKGNVIYNSGLSNAGSLVFNYTNTDTNWINDSFKFKVTNSCSESSEIIVPITRARKQSSTNEDVYVYVNTTSMDYTDAVDLKATFEAIKLKMQTTCNNWTGSIYYIPVDTTTDAGDYLNYPKSLIDMKGGASGSITVAGGAWTTWKSTPAHWDAASKESVPTSATIIAFTNTTTTNTNYAFANLSDGWIGQPTPSYQTQYEELQDLIMGTEVTAWGISNNTETKYFGTNGTKFKQILIPIIDSSTGESAASILQMMGAISGEKLKAAEVNGIKIGDGSYSANIGNYLLDGSGAAQAPYSVVTSNNVTMKGLKDSGFTIASWMDKGTVLGTTNEDLQADLMAVMGLDPTLVATNCPTSTECSYKMKTSGDGSVLWGHDGSVSATACSNALSASHNMEIYSPSTSTEFGSGLWYKSAAGACSGTASDQIDAGIYAGGGTGTRKHARYVTGAGFDAGTIGTC